MTDNVQNLNEEIINEAAVEATEATDATQPATDVASAPATAATPSNLPPRRDFRGRGRAPRGKGDRGGDRRGGPRREARAKPEFDQKIIDIRRVTRVASGGRRFSFAVSLVAGDRKGKVGVGTGKGGDTALAVEKAFRSAKKHMITVNTTKSGSIPHEVKTKFGSAVVHMMPAPGKGVVAGSSVRDVIELGGIKDITASFDLVQKINSITLE
jgi:small subunit ribosomal protein S5